MSQDRNMRVGNADRERVVEQLRKHTAEGRLTLEEFSDRVSEVYAARTAGELATTLRELPTDRAARAVAERRKRKQRLYAHLRPYIFTCLMCIAIWAITSRSYFWPIWVIVPWGIVLLSHAVMGLEDDRKLDGPEPRRERSKT